jgi:hypothetical protein
MAATASAVRSAFSASSTRRRAADDLRVALLDAHEVVVGVDRAVDVALGLGELCGEPHRRDLRFSGREQVGDELARTGEIAALAREIGQLERRVANILDGARRRGGAAPGLERRDVGGRHGLGPAGELLA